MTSWRLRWLERAPQQRRQYEPADCEGETREGYERTIAVDQIGVWVGYEELAPRNAGGRWRLDHQHQLDLRLASDSASYMTGSEVYADGGWTAR